VFDMRVINFNPGPAGLPLPALERMRDELLDFEGSGMSIVEHSHRGKVYEKVHHEAGALVKKLLAVPDSHTVMFLQGGATMQFALVPLNFLHPGKSADYVVAGAFGEKAIEEARAVGTVRAAWQEKNEKGQYVRVPRREEIKIDPSAAYIHTTSNNTIFGTQFHELPDFGVVPHVCDMSSDFLSRPVDVSKFAFIYAGAQKNIGPSGLVVAIAHKEFLARARTDGPKFLHYKEHAEHDSMLNTPNTIGVYLARNVLAWLDQHGGLAWMETRNLKKAALLYQAIDARPDYYRSPVEKQSRSRMNVVFRLPSAELEEKFVAEARKQNMVGLKGHRSVGGIRVSLYNAVSEDDVHQLVSFMDTFAKANG
jgi:phosphoserine aminotransferase